MNPSGAEDVEAGKGPAHGLDGDEGGEGGEHAEVGVPRAPRAQRPPQPPREEGQPKEGGRLKQTDSFVCLPSVG